MAEALRAAQDSFERMATDEQACLLTLPLLLLHVDKYWYLSTPVIALALAGLLFPAARRSLLLWFTLFCLLAAGVVYNWSEVDNHKYLLAYWVLAIVGSLALSDKGRSLTVSARLLIGLTFAFALFWKLTSPDFRSGEFFHFALLFDPRFSGKLEALSLAAPDMLELNRVAHRALTSYDSHLAEVDLALDPRVDRLARTMSWWTLSLEALCATAFLAPVRSFPARLRHGLLLAFVISTYAVAPVIGFGWVLLAMGFVQCDRSHLRTRLLYLGTLLLLQAFRLPWASITQAMGA